MLCVKPCRTSDQFKRPAARKIRPTARKIRPLVRYRLTHRRLRSFANFFQPIYTRTICIALFAFNMKHSNHESEECNWVQAREDEEANGSWMSGSEDEGDDCDSSGDSFTVSFEYN